MNWIDEKNNKKIFLSFLAFRYGVLLGHLRAHMRVLSPIPTAHQDFESSVPSPTHGNSQSTLAAKQMLQWTQNISVSFGDTSLPSTVFQQKVKWVQRKFHNTNNTEVPLDENTRTTKTLNAVPLNACQDPYLDNMCLLHVEDSNVCCFTTRTISVEHSFPQLKCSYKSLFYTRIPLHS